MALGIKFGRFKLFPGGVETFIIKINAPTGYTLEETEKFCRAVENEVAKLTKEELESYVTRVGIVQKDVNDPFTKRGKNFAMVMVYLTPDSQRTKTTDEIINSLRKKTEWLMDEKALAVAKEKEKIMQKTSIVKFGSSKEAVEPYDIPAEFINQKGKLTALDLEKIQGGPPVGKPIAIEIRGDDYNILKKIAEDFKNEIKKVDGVIDIGDDYIDGKDEIRLTINESLASQTGLSVQQIALAVNTAFQGTVATTIKRSDGEVDVRVRFPESYRNSIRALEKVFVTNNFGNLIPVSKMISYEKRPGLSAINHLDGKRLLTVTANLDDTKTDPRKANAAIKKEVDKSAFLDRYPVGYRVRYGGENKDTEESLGSLGRSFFVAFIIIFMILASLFKSFIQPVIVATAIPFSFMGVIIAFITHGHYFSFLSFIGIVGLSGIVVNDSIVLVDFANQLRAQKPEMSTFDLLLETGVVRLRPVILTTVTTVLGILPTAYGIGGADPFLMPMALAIGWGLAFATSLTLILIPVLYKIVYDIHDSIKGMKSKNKKNLTGELQTA
jgi:multidrug efflux pump subunit AcrB